MIVVLLALAAGGLTATVYGIRRANHTLNRILTEER